MLPLQLKRSIGRPVALSKMPTSIRFSGGMVSSMDHTNKEICDLELHDERACSLLPRDPVRLLGFSSPPLNARHEQSQSALPL